MVLNDLCTEIKLLQNIPDITNSTSVQTILEWLERLQDSNKIEIISNISKALHLFVTIPVTSRSYKRCFSKTNIVKSKLQSTMTQTRLGSLLVEQYKTKNVNTDEVIEEFKVLNDNTPFGVLTNN